MPNDIVMVGKKRKQVLNKAAAAPAPPDCCFDAIRAFSRKCRVFRERFQELKEGNRVARKRMLREFVPIIVEIEREAVATRRTLETLAPTGRPLAQDELAALMVSRKLSPQG
jgi:hypothetical protein